MGFAGFFSCEAARAAFRVLAIRALGSEHRAKELDVSFKGSGLPLRAVIKAVKCLAPCR